jgi:predicted secreted protein
MGWVSGPVVYFLIWWVSLFMVLPWGNAPDENPTLGNITSAPAKPRLLLKFFATAILAAIIWLVVFFVIKLDIINFGHIADQMMKQDGLQ